MRNQCTNPVQKMNIAMNLLPGFKMFFKDILPWVPEVIFVWQGDEEETN